MIASAERRRWLSASFSSDCYVPYDASATRLRLLTIASLYPNARMPSYGIFVENRLRRIAATGALTSHVIAPVPWFISNHPFFGSYARWSEVPRAERRHGFAVAHPRYGMLPKIGFWLQPWLMYLAVRRYVSGLYAMGGVFDLVDAQYYYPDGVVAYWLARDLGLPFVVTARGTDVNSIPRSPIPRELIRRTAGAAAASIAVCGALRNALVDLGSPTASTVVLTNGVDLELFCPKDKVAARAKLGLSGHVLLSVGHLIERKGHHLTIEALSSLPDCTLCLVGDGPDRKALETLANRSGVGERVRFLGEVPQTSLPEYYRAADMFVLASSREGCANVLLEAMACGTPVVATPVWGTPEIVADPAAGRLLAIVRPQAWWKPSRRCRLLCRAPRRPGAMRSVLVGIIQSVVK